MLPCAIRGAASRPAAPWPPDWEATREVTGLAEWPRLLNQPVRANRPAGVTPSLVKHQIDGGKYRVQPFGQVPLRRNDMGIVHHESSPCRVRFAGPSLPWKSRTRQAISLSRQIPQTSRAAQQHLQLWVNGGMTTGEDQTQSIVFDLLLAVRAAFSSATSSTREAISELKFGFRRPCKSKRIDRLADFPAGDQRALRICQHPISLPNLHGGCVRHRCMASSARSSDHFSNRTSQANTRRETGPVEIVDPVAGSSLKASRFISIIFHASLTTSASRIDIGSDGEILPDSIQNLKSAIQNAHPQQKFKSRRRSCIRNQQRD